MSSKKGIWISYDFGIKGDYTGLFTWLDNHKAVECGEGLAFFQYDLTNLTNTDDSKELINHLSKELNEYIKLSKSDRLYIIWKDDNTGKVKGEFISGSRKRSPWEGFGKLNNKKVVDSD